MSEANSIWHHEIPAEPGLYWRTVRTSIGSWHTDLVNVSIERRFDSSVVTHVTLITPDFLNCEPESPKTRQYRSERDRCQGEYFSAVVALPTPPKPAYGPSNKVPLEPGLYYRNVNASDASGWYSTLVSLSILRAHGYEDKAWEIDLPDVHLSKAYACTNAYFGERLPIEPPAVLPDGMPLFLPETTREGTRPPRGAHR
jgi:hypothetical protein